MRHRRLGTQGKRSRGVTLLEVMIACGVLGMVFAAVAYIQSASVKQIRTLYSDARTLHRAHLVIERIRYKLIMAQVGSVEVVAGSNGRSISYINPNLGGVIRSGFKFEEKKVYYYEDMSGTASAPGDVGPVEDIVYEILGAGNAVRITAKTLQKYSWKLDRPYTLISELTLRN